MLDHFGLIFASHIVKMSVIETCNRNPLTIRINCLVVSSITTFVHLSASNPGAIERSNY